MKTKLRHEEETEDLVEKEFRHPWDWNVKSTAIVLRARGDAERHRLSGADRQVTSKTGEYVAETSKRFWLPYDVKAGWIHVFVEGDPEPVTTRDPEGYDAKTLGLLVGPYIPHIVGASFKGVRAREQMLYIIIAGLGLLAFFFGYQLYQAGMLV